MTTIDSNIFELPDSAFAAFLRVTDSLNTHLRLGFCYLGMFGYVLNTFIRKNDGEVKNDGKKVKKYMRCGAIRSDSFQAAVTSETVVDQTC